MPALVAFGRSWGFGSDDLFIPALITTIFRVITLVAILIGAFYFIDSLFCQGSHLLGGLAITVICSTALVGVVEGCIIVFSARGTIVHTKPRAPVVHLLHFRFVLFLIEVILLIIETVFAHLSHEELPADSACPDLKAAVLLVQLSVGANWISIFILVAAILTYIDPCHCYTAKVNHKQIARRIRHGDIDKSVVEMQWKLNHTVWEKRFKVACCFAGRDEHHRTAYGEIAELFAHIFCDTNVVLSDIVAGLVLLQREQLAKEERRRINKSREVDDVNAFDFSHKEDCDLFKKSMYFIKYAMGMYTWVFYLYQNLCCGVCQLCCSFKCGQNRGRYSNIHKDNSCMCHLASLQRMTGIHNADIVYASFENSVYKVPFVVCLDHDMESVVITFRGTLSFQDIVTDLTASTCPIPLQGYPDFLVHKGMLKTVQWVMAELERNRCLETAFSRANSYKLVIVGHSLGSGCAGILSILLKERYPDLKCYCYSPTGSLLNEAAAIFTEEFVTSITLGKDIVARMNFPNANKLKSNLIQVLESCRKPKCQILLEGLLETVGSCIGRSVVFESQSRHSVSHEDHSESDGTGLEEDSLLVIMEEGGNHQNCDGHTPTNNDRQGYTPLLLPHMSSLSLPIRATHPDNSDSNTTDHETQQLEQRLEPLYLPGRIIHIVDADTTKRCVCASRQNQARWSSRYSFKTILISPEMLRDHLPDVLERAMRKIWQENVEESKENSVE